MGDKTKIEWADASWNPMRGCSPVSAGCKNCYAKKVARRFSGPGMPYEGLTDQRGEWSGDLRYVVEHLNDPLRWKKPRSIFPCSMSDIFHENALVEWTDRIWSVMERAEQHRFLVLTKRPHIMQGYMAKNYPPPNVLPPPNVWLGVSVENQAAAEERLPLLMETRGAHRWVSCEPLLERVSLTEWAHNLEWVVAGAESGPGRARPCERDWMRTLRNECQDHGIPFILKQLCVDGFKVPLPMLDGKVWNESPS